jgi:RHS repeat-associated protein
LLAVDEIMVYKTACSDMLTMVSMQARKSKEKTLIQEKRWFRPVAVLTALATFASSSAMGIHGIVSGLTPILTLQSGWAPHFTEEPGPVWLGENPGRDEDRLLWNGRPGNESSGIAQNFQEALESGGLIAGPFGVASAMALGGTVGGFAPGEGSSSGGGSGGTMGTQSMTNTNTGNLMTAVPIVSWEAAGDLEVDFKLYHNSRRSYTDARLGQSWSHSYDISVVDDGISTFVRWGDGLEAAYTFSGGVFQRPAGIFDTLVKNTNNTWTVTTRDQEKYQFDTAGRLTSFQDRYGNSKTITRDGSHRITAITAPGGRQLTFTYNAGGRLETVTDPTGRVWTLNYNGSAQLTGVVYPALGGVTHTRSFTYNSLHDILSETDLRGNLWEWGYDSSQRVIWSETPLNHRTNYTYNASNTVITLPGGQTTTHNYTSGVLASDVDQGGFSLNYSTRDANRLPTRITDRSGKIWDYTWNAFGRMLTHETPLNHTTTYTYNTNNDLLTVTTPLLHVTTFTWTGLRLDKVQDDLGRDTVRYTYDSFGQVDTEKDALNRTSTYTYDSHGAITTSVDPAAVTTTAVFDNLNRPTSVTVGGNTTTFAYDTRARLTTITHPGATGSVSYGYDLNGNLTSVTDEISRVTSYVYDASNRRTSWTNPRGDVETYAYNSNGWRTSTVNGRSHTRTYGYTARGDVANLTMPDGAVEQWSYDGRGNTTLYTSPLAYGVTYTFDDSNRQTGVDYPVGTADVTFGYDISSRQTTMTDGTGTSTWTYNDASEITSLAQPGGTISYTYNLAGQRLTMVEPRGTSTYAYDSAGRLQSLTDPESRVTTWTYDSLSRVSRRTIHAGTYDDYTYDVRDRVLTMNTRNGGGTLLRAQSWTYDSASQVISHTLAGTATTYTYDLAGQLLTESRTGYSASYTYDGNGNRASRTVNGVTETYAYDSGDKLTGITGGLNPRTFTYDAAGRTSSVISGSGTTTLTYDHESRITQIAYPGGATSTFGYNGLDTRTSKNGPSGTRNYLRDGAYVTDPVVQDGWAAYTPTISQVRSGTVRYNHSGLKSMDIQSTASQTISSTIHRDAFGNQTSINGAWTGPFGYAGGFGYQQDSDSGLMLLGHRYYDPSTGRFLTRDPIKDGRNWYSYGGGQLTPVAVADPSGLAIPLIWVLYIVGGTLIANGLIETGEAINEGWSNYQTTMKLKRMYAEHGINVNYNRDVGQGATNATKPLIKEAIKTVYGYPGTNFRGAPIEVTGKYEIPKEVKKLNDIGFKILEDQYGD